MVKRVIIICLPLLLGGCLGLPSFLAPSGGVSVTPIGTNIAREVDQTAVKSETTTSAGRDVITTETLAAVDEVETQNITNNQIPPWIIFVALLGWLLPTPTQMGLAIWNAILVLTMPLTKLKRRSGE